MRSTGLFAFAATLAGLTFQALRAEDSKVLIDFEEDADIARQWQLRDQNEYFKAEKAYFKPALSEQHVTQGKKCLKAAVNEYMFWNNPATDWSGYDALEIDIFLEGNDPVGGTLLIADKDFQKKASYWNRHNGTFNLKPGANTVSIPVNGLFRGEAGSRGNDLKTNINPKEIVRFDIGFNSKEKTAALYIDNMRLVKEAPPEGIFAYDFGPESQTVFPGFTPVSWNTQYGKDGRTFGVGPRAGWGKSLARDDTFPTRLYQDFVEMGTDPDMHQFTVEVPNGKYQVWVVFDDCGYWGGEEAQHKRRFITANGKEAWVDDRGEAGPTDYLYRFENVEPKPGDSMWELYAKNLFKPARLEADVADGKLVLAFKSDRGWSCKVAAVIVYPDAKKAEAEKWVANVEERNRKEFESRAAFMGPKPKDLKIPDDAKAKGYWLGFPALEQDVLLVDEPGKAEGNLKRAAAKGQRLSFSFAVRPLKDLGEAKLSATDFKGPGGSIPAANVDLRFVQHATKRSFNDIAFQIVPESLRKFEGSGLKLGKDFTRQFWITVAVPSDAKPGTYAGEVSLSAGDAKIALPVSVDVMDIALDEPDFVFGFFGLTRDRSGYLNVLKLLKENGMNAVSGGPNISFKGFDANGKPQFDFAACDAFFKEVKEAGFTKEVHCYGGPAMVEGLHDGYHIGETGKKWAAQIGKTFPEVLKIVWGAVKEHAEKEGWPPVAYGMTDEPRVIEDAQLQLELHKAYREAVPFVKTGGYYSVHWGSEPLDKAIQDIFKTFVWSGLNLHTQTDMDKAKEFGREIYIYNQGISRYSFGEYQWAEMRKGVKGRMQWHLLALHGYQFFDLDGREPDTAMINLGKNEVIPTIHLPRCREGADDFRWAVTLWNLAQKKKDAPESKAALAFLEDVNKKIGINQGARPEGLMDDETFRNTCIEHVKKLLQAR